MILKKHLLMYLDNRLNEFIVDMCEIQLKAELLDHTESPCCMVLAEDIRLSNLKWLFSTL